MSDTSNVFSRLYSHSTGLKAKHEAALVESRRSETDRWQTKLQSNNMLVTKPTTEAPTITVTIKKVPNGQLTAQQRPQTQQSTVSSHFTNTTHHNYNYNKKFMSSSQNQFFCSNPTSNPMLANACVESAYVKIASSKPIKEINSNNVIIDNNNINSTTNNNKNKIVNNNINSSCPNNTPRKGANLKKNTLSTRSADPSQFSQFNFGIDPNDSYDKMKKNKHYNEINNSRNFEVNFRNNDDLNNNINNKKNNINNSTNDDNKTDPEGNDNNNLSNNNGNCNNINQNNENNLDDSLCVNFNANNNNNLCNSANDNIDNSANNISDNSTNNLNSNFKSTPNSNSKNNYYNNFNLNITNNNNNTKNESSKGNYKQGMNVFDPVFKPKGQRQKIKKDSSAFRSSSHIDNGVDWGQYEREYPRARIQNMFTQSMVYETKDSAWLTVRQPDQISASSSQTKPIIIDWHKDIDIDQPVPKTSAISSTVHSWEDSAYTDHLSTML